jgi:diphosphomevalonate decarboxylase
LSVEEFIPKTNTKTIEKASYTWQTPSNIALVKYWGEEQSSNS